MSIEAQLAQAVELNKVLYEAVTHYADEAQWCFPYHDKPTKNWYLVNEHGYTVAQAALAQHRALLDAHIALAAAQQEEPT